MKKLVTYAIAVVGLIATRAFAADMPVKAPRLAPSPVYSWTGWYVGGNVGYSWGKADTDINVAPGTATFGGSGTFTVPGFVGSDSTKPKGIIGGGQIGYNSQRDNFILGIEADFQASDEKASRNRADPFASLTDLGNSQFFSLSGTATTDYETKISWFGTLRGRVGYLITPSVFAYATGGLAYGRVEISGTTNVSGTGTHLDCSPQPQNPCIPGSAIPFGGAASSFGRSSINVGWTLGGGFEGALWDRWSWKAEYLYMDLGSIDDPSIAGSATVGAITTHTHFTDNVMRVGLNYRFH